MAASATRKMTDRARAKAAEWFSPIAGANLNYLVGSGVPSLTEAIADESRAIEDRLMIAFALEMCAQAIAERLVEEANAS